MSEDIDVADAYSRGSAVFMGMEMLVASGALVPRPETELLGSTAIDVLRQMKLSAPRVVDMCCGAGNLACAIAHQVPTARVWASDLTDGCVEVACRNVIHHGLADRVSVLQGDLFEALATPVSPGSIDLVVCNPPYISEKRLEGDRSHLVTLEPREAFAAGPYGIAIHMRVVKDALRYLRPGGALLFEVGLGQERQVASLFERSRSYEGVRAVTNRAGEARVVLGYAKPQS
ncbi:methyltransferase [Mesorhizobium hawassense]|uniref:peptide chain release factor N(5)-glutamine methyltransferase n=1 Tax=Mesorhizobium hawassense TaxID=1209954 RepID=A0A330HZS4_9HYPH|nr:class I SAM-dependent methyltransferase [Mesorhizobium hawassense]RAZ92524.1 methyltransferase [Mesorhizobium hawassense]